MKKLVAGFVVLTFLFAGCTGSFSITKKLYGFHRAQDKWIDETVFLVCVILPVYGVTLLVDGLVVNSIEFWTGDNPVASNNPEPVSIAKGKDTEAVLNYDRSRGQVLLSILKDNNDIRNFTFEKTAHGVVARDSSGQIRFTAVTNDDGSVSLYNGQQQLVQTFDQASVAAVHERFKG